MDSGYWGHGLGRKPGGLHRYPLASMANIVMDDIKTLPQRLRTACESFRKSTPIVRIELPLGLNYDGTFTTGDAQTFAVTVLDAICTAFDR